MAANETGQERTEEATPKKKEKAFDEGRIPKSQEVTGAVIVLTGIALLATGGGTIVTNAVVALTRQTAVWIADGRAFDGAAVPLLRHVVVTLTVGLGPIIGGIAGIALLANLIQARGVLSVKPITPKFSHISPLAGVKRIVSVQSLFTLVKSIVKLAMLASLAYMAFGNAWPEMLVLPGQSPGDVLAVTRNHTVRLTVVIGTAFLAFSILDYLFQVNQHNRQLRMTRQEVTQEHKDTDGDPLIKSRVKSIAMAMSRKRMMKDVATADVVVTNPTHYAVALKYDPAVAAAPTVVAMGARKLAQRIKAIAKENRIPVVENKPLAQALIATAIVGQAVPPALYVAVAEVLAFVYRKQGKSPSGAAPSGGLS